MFANAFQHRCNDVLAVRRQLDLNRLAHRWSTFLSLHLNVYTRQSGGSFADELENFETLERSLVLDVQLDENE